MHLSHFAKRPVAALVAVSLVLAACSSTEPDAPFDPAGMNADVGATIGAFDAPAIASYGAVASEVSTAIGGSPSAAVALAPSGSLVTRAGAVRFAQQLMTRFQARTGQGPNFAISSIPSDIAGKTFEYDLQTQHYVATDRAGAPADGVRFILYEIDSQTGLPAASLNEVGYFQLTATESGAPQSVHVTVVGTPGDVTYFDCAMTVTYTSSLTTFSLSGFVTNGVDRVNFTYSLRATPDQKATLSYVFTVPVSGFRLETTMSLDFNALTAQISILARGPHGRVNITGTSSETSDVYTVQVNGQPFATITITESSSTIVGANGQPLSEDELDTLQHLISGLYNGLDFFKNLLTPFGAL